MEAANIEVSRTPDRFEARVEGGEIAYADYKLGPDGVLFPHTVVPEAAEGQGVGSALAKAGLAFAREQGVKVLPACAFFAAYMKRHFETQDLVHPDWRERLGLA